MKGRGGYWGSQFRYLGSAEQERRPWSDNGNSEKGFKIWNLYDFLFYLHCPIVFVVDLSPGEAVTKMVCCKHCV